MLGLLVRGIWDFLVRHRRRLMVYGGGPVVAVLALTFALRTVSGLLPENWRPYLQLADPAKLLGRLFRQPTPIDLGVPSVRVIRVSPSEHNPSIEVSGAIEYFEKVNVASRVSGRIEAFYAREGDRVRPGQVLVQLERLPLQLQHRQEVAAYDAAAAQKRLADERYDKARQAIEGRLKNIEKLETRAKELKAELDKIRVTYERKEQVFKEEGLSQEDFDLLKTQVISREAQYRIAVKDLEIARVGFRDEDIHQKLGRVPAEAARKRVALIDINTLVEKAEVEVAQSRVVSARAALENTKDLLTETTIRSPINGVVASRNTSVGEQVRGGAAVSPTEAIMVLVKTDPVYARVSIRESEMHQIRVGGPLLFTVDAHPKRNFQARIALIGPLVDAKTHTATVKAQLANQDGGLKPGMFIRAKIPLGGPQKVIAVPATALIPREQDNAWVFLVREQRTYRQEVRIGRQLDERVEVISGLRSGDLLALEKLGQLHDGLTVRPVPDATAR